jgi:hypothetical protein
MRKVRVPAFIGHEVTLMRRRAARRGHTTGRSVLLKPLGQTSLWDPGVFMVGAYVVCSACGQEFPCSTAPLPQCRGHK